VLLSLVKNNSGEWWSIESNSGSVADDDTGEEELIENGTIDGSKSSAVGALLSPVLLDPAGKDASVGEDEDGLLEAFLELSDEFFIDGGEEELAAAEVDVEEDEGLVLLVGVLGSLDDQQTGSQLLALSIKVVDGLNNRTSNLLLQMRKSLYRTRLILHFSPRGFSRTSRQLFLSQSSVIRNNLLK
jgi:hypothetical protein